MSQDGLGERAPWGEFPPVVSNGDLGGLKNEPEYEAAKAGDRDAALQLADRLMTDDAVAQVAKLLAGKKAKIVPVLAAEEAGRNKIPLMAAEVLADRLGLEVEYDIVQTHKVGRTNQGADHRLAFNPSFSGEVEAGERYLVVDDTLTMGGTVASLRGYIENRGGHVVGGMVMTAHPGALDIKVKQKMLHSIERKHGATMDEYWKQEFGYGIDQLTQGEAGHLKAAQSVDAIRDRITAARNEAGRRMGQGPTSQAQSRQSHKSPAYRPSGGQGRETGLKEQAEGLANDQESLAVAAEIEKRYDAVFQNYLEAKHEQVERLTDKLEHMIENQQSILTRLENKRPGFLARPSTRQAWSQTVQQQKTKIRRMERRLGRVHEIEEGMTVTGPKLVELASRKIRAHDPELAKSWEGIREELRRQQEKERQAKRDQKKTQKQSRGRAQSRGLSQ